jgi:GPH family glycoside/pentoside/hexuronide:cation symporter
MASLAPIFTNEDRSAGAIGRPTKLSTGRLIAFSAIAMPIYAVQVPISVYLPAIFSQTYGLPLSTLGLIFLVEKLWGTVADPLVGALSDRTRNRLGRRRSWILAGSAVFGTAGVTLFFPPAGVSALYLGLALFVFYLGWSMIQIPFFAWSGEVSADYDERTRVATYQTVAASLGLLLVLVLPTLIDQLHPGDGALRLHAMGGLILATLGTGLALTLSAFPEPPLPKRQNRRLSLRQTVRLVAANPLLMRVFASDFAVTLGQNIRGTLFVFFVSIYMGLPQWASGLFLLQFVFGIAAGPIWMKLGQRLGKHRAAVAGELLQVMINLGLLFVAPGQLPLLLVLTVAQGFTQGSGNLMLRSMVADIADEYRLKTGEDRTGLFFSVFSISIKAAMAAAVGIALPLVAWLGFDPKAVHNSPQALRGLLLVFALGPALAHIISAALINRFPLDAAAHGRIREKLALRDAGDSVPSEALF